MRENAKMSTKRICELIQAGNELALTNLINYFSSELYVFALGFVKQKMIAEELVSDVFVQIWENRETINELNDIKAYLYILVRNKSISYLRKNKKERFVSLDTLEEFHLTDFHSNNNQLIDSETMEQVNRAIADLPPRAKMAFVLAKVNGLKYKEIAKIMDVSVKTIDNQVAYALKNICKSLNVPQTASNRKINRMLSVLIVNL